MSHPYEEMVRRAYAAFNRGDYDAMVEICHPGVEWDSGETSVEGDQVKRGVDAVKNHLMPDVFESQQATVENATVHGEKVIVQTNFRIRTAGSGIELENRAWQVWTMDAGKARRVEIFLDQAEALAAAGVAADGETAG